MMDFDSVQAEAKKAWEAQTDGSRPRIIIGMATCSISAGAKETLQAVKKELTRKGIDAEVNITGCIGLCYQEPLVDVALPGRHRISYGPITTDLVPQLLGDVLSGKETAAELAVGTFGPRESASIPHLFDIPFMRFQTRRLLARCGLIDPENIDHYIALGGYSALAKAMSMPPEQVIDEVKRSQIRGRGGAAYPAGLKWEQCRAAKGYPKYIVCNADEGDPGSFVDRTVLESDPHEVLEGMLIAAYAIGSDSGYIYIRGEYPLAAHRFSTALRQAEEKGLLGANVLGSDFQFHVEIRRGAGSYVCGESSALMSSIEGLRGMPRLKRPRSVEKGLWAKPTSMNNVETFANVPLIINNGGDEYASTGMERSTGTKLFSLSGHVLRTGVAEVPFGTSLQTVIEDIGGGPLPGRKIKGVMPGGPAGGVIPATMFDLPIDFDTLAKAGSMVGSGGLVVFDDRTCIVDLARYSAAFMRDECCDRCSTCRTGTQKLVAFLDALSCGDGKPGDLERLGNLGEVVKRLSHCGLGQTAPNTALGALAHFRSEVEAHLLDKRCPAKVCSPLVQYRIDPLRCTLCGLCAPACPTQAIIGNGKLSIIDENCIRCGICYVVCRDEAVVVESGVAVRALV